MDLELKGKRVLVTGASKGIGYSCALAYARERALPVRASRDHDALEAAATTIQQATGVVPQFHAVDIGTQAAIDSLLKAVGDVDIRVNNAGAIPGGNLAQVDDARWRAAWELKVFGFINMTRAWLPRMKERKTGVIANVIGMAAPGPKADYVSGTTANVGLVAFTRAIGGESPRDNVRVFGINPGQTRISLVLTLSRQRPQSHFGDADRWPDLMTGLPLGRLMEPDEVANTVVFCSSVRFGFISGSVIDMDDGQLHAPPPRQS